MKVVACGICGSPAGAVCVWLYRCRVCGFWQSSLTPGAGIDVEGIDDLRRANFERFLDRIERFQPLRGKRILEVGPSTGLFLEAAAKRGAKLFAIEPDEENVRSLRTRYGDAIEHGFFPGDLQDRGPYDAIVFNDVFEHIPNPAAAAASIPQLLTTGGLLAINCPSSDGALYRIALAMFRLRVASPLERLWQKDFASPHVSYFNRRTLRKVVEENGGLPLVDWFPLQTVSRKGLYRRVRASYRGAAAVAALAGVYAVSFVLPHLPPDIQAGLFVKPSDRNDGTSEKR